MPRARFWIAAGALFIAMLFHTMNAPWVHDFWEHVAVVRELAVRPFHPRHPLLLLDVPHAFFSPYAVALGLATGATGTAPMTTLAVAGLVNLVIVITGLRALAHQLFPDGDRAAFWALLFMLFLWGRGAWVWSGFLHFHALGYVLPYPSTFAAGLTLHAIALYLRMLTEERPLLHVPLALIAAVVLLTHPTTAASLFLGLAAAFLARVRGRVVSQGALLAAVAATTIAVAALWPYFSVFDLWQSQAGAFNAASRKLDRSVPGRIWPALLLAPALVWRLTQSRRDVLVLWFASLAGIVTWAFVSDTPGYWRLLAYVMLVLQLGAAGLLAHLEVALPPGRAVLASTAALAFVAAFATQAGDAFARCSPFRGPNVSPVAFLVEYVRPGDIVLSDLETSWEIPAFTGRIVASRHPIYWVPDHLQRRTDVERFFAPGMDDDVRKEILRRWDARFILVDRARVGLSAEEAAHVIALGRTVATRGALVLVETER